MDPAEGQKLLDLIAEIDKVFWETKAAAGKHHGGRRAIARRPSAFVSAPQGGVAAAAPTVPAVTVRACP
jgi:hypothetical protein